MAIKKIQIVPPDNGYTDVLHPETSADMIIGQGLFGTTTGTNAYVVSMPNVTSLYAGLRVTVKFAAANTAASTLNVSGLGAKSIVKAGGAALSSGNIKANGVYTLVYDGVSFQLQGEGGEYGTAQASDVLAPKTIGTNSGIITGTIPSKGAATITPTTSNQTIAAGQYLSGVQTIAGVTVPVANVLTGTTIAGAAGTMPNRGAVTNTLTTQGGAYTIPAGYHSGAGKVTASFANLVAGNIKSGVNVGGVVGTAPVSSLSTAPLDVRVSSSTQEKAYGVLLKEGAWNPYKTLTGNNVLVDIATITMDVDGYITFYMNVAFGVAAKTVTISVFRGGVELNSRGASGSGGVMSNVNSLPVFVSVGDVITVKAKISASYSEVRIYKVGIAVSLPSSDSTIVTH